MLDYFITFKIKDLITYEEEEESSCLIDVEYSKYQEKKNKIREYLIILTSCISRNSKKKRKKLNEYIYITKSHSGQVDLGKINLLRIVLVSSGMSFTFIGHVEAASGSFSDHNI
jgi:hypothetical protein